MKSPFCLINLHHWSYRKEKHKIIGHPHDRENIYVNMRICKRCGKRQQRMLPTQDGKIAGWKNCIFDKNETIIFESI